MPGKHDQPIVTSQKNYLLLIEKDERRKRERRGEKERERRNTDIPKKAAEVRANTTVAAVRGKFPSISCAVKENKRGAMCARE
jgi:hypothetical protein